MNAPKRTPEKPRFYRCSFSLPPRLAVQISDLAKRFGCSQSALLAELLEQPIGAMHAMLDDVRPDYHPDRHPEVARRLRGQSEQFIRSAVRDALQLVDDQ